jgi:hypothetical protein
VVAEDEEVSGQAIAVLGNVRIDGAVDDQVVSVLGSVSLGPHAIVRGDLVTVGGHLHRSPGSEVHGAVTEVSLGDIRVNMYPFLGVWGPPYLIGGLGPITRLVGSTLRFLLLAMIGAIALVIARRPVEGSARRAADTPVKTTVVGLAAWVLFVPVIILTTVVLAISVIGIPLLVLMPFAVLVLLLMALVGFTGTAYAIGQGTRRRFGMSAGPAILDIVIGLFLIFLPLLMARVLALGGWPLRPIVFLLLATALGVEFLAWSCGFGAVLTNTFVRWQATRATRAAARAAAAGLPPP